VRPSRQKIRKRLKNSQFQLGFCLAAAVISDSFADPIVESASNAGWFGTGSFTDHSSANVLPTLFAGAVLLAFYFVRRARVIAAQNRADTLARVLPAIFVLQLGALYVMETFEQLAVWRHTLGPTVWLGAPAPTSIAIHAAICAAVAFALLRSKRRLAAATLRVMAIVTAIATRSAVPEKPLATHRTARVRVQALLPVLCTIGERAPPIASR
jgi:hypothetical protein